MESLRHRRRIEPALTPAVPSPSEAGFTLVEALIAMVVLTIGLVSMAELLAVTLRLQQLGRSETEAVRLAQDKLDQLMSLNFAAAAEIQLNGVDSLASNVANYFDTVPGYTRRWDIAAGPDSAAGPVATIRQVTVRVIPDVTDNRTAATYELVTIIHAW